MDNLNDFKKWDEEFLLKKVKDLCDSARVNF